MECKSNGNPTKQLLTTKESCQRRSMNETSKELSSKGRCQRKCGEERYFRRKVVELRQAQGKLRQSLGNTEIEAHTKYNPENKNSKVKKRRERLGKERRRLKLEGFGCHRPQQRKGRQLRSNFQGWLREVELFERKKKKKEDNYGV